MTEVAVTTGAISHTKKSNCHHQQTNTQLFTGRMSVTQPTCQSIEGKTSHHKLTWGIPALWLTSEGSQLP